MNKPQQPPFTRGDENQKKKKSYLLDDFVYQLVQREQHVGLSADDGTAVVLKLGVVGRAIEQIVECAHEPGTCWGGKEGDP